MTSSNNVFISEIVFQVKHLHEDGGFRCSIICINHSTAFGEPLTFPIWKTWEPVHPDTGKHWYLLYEPFFWTYSRWQAIHEDQIGFALVKGLE